MAGLLCGEIATKEARHKKTDRKIVAICCPASFLILRFV